SSVSFSGDGLYLISAEFSGCRPAFNGLDRPTLLPDDLEYVDVRGKSFRDIQQELLGQVKKTTPGLVVFDSYESVFGNGIDPTMVGQTFGQLAAFDTTIVIIDHEAKGEPNVKNFKKIAYGSVYKFNFSRCDLSLSSKRQGNKTLLTFNHMKASHGEEQSGFLAILEWNVDKDDQENGSVICRNLKFSEVEAFKGKATTASKKSGINDDEVLARLEDGMKAPEWLEKAEADDLIGQTTFYDRLKQWKDEGRIHEQKGRYYHADGAEAAQAA
ncbi:MAG: hypothetical protein ACREQR_19065, partial [Candidatus Binataceae bacterium]